MEIKRTLTGTLIFVLIATIGLMAFIRITSSGKSAPVVFARVMKGSFEISVSNTGELITERSVDIKGPDLIRNMYFRAAALKITDLVPEGTIVRKGDYVATLDRSNFSNILKDENDNLKNLESQYEMKLLDTAVVLSTLRDDIKDQVFTVEEAKIIVDQSLWEPPANQRKASLDLDDAQRHLEQKRRIYFLRLAQNSADIRNLRIDLEGQQRKVNDLEKVLADFTITAPQDGMIVYKRDRLGNKIRAGTVLNPFDPVVATLPDLNSIMSKIYVSEIDINKVKPGQPVLITVDAFQGKTYNGYIGTIANIGEMLPNSDTKVFEVLARFEDLDPMLRPTMTTNNKVIIKTYSDILYVPLESLHADADNIPFVYTKDETKQIVIPGESNDKYTIIERGLTAGTQIYLAIPENHEKFRLAGKDLIAEIRERERARQAGGNEVLAEGITGIGHVEQQGAASHE